MNLQYYNYDNVVFLGLSDFGSDILIVKYFFYKILQNLKKAYLESRLASRLKHDITYTY